MASNDRTIGAPVGIGQQNDPADVRQVQRLLDWHLAAPHGDGHLADDGVFGPRTAMRVIEYQRDTVGLRHPDGVAAPDGPTMRSLTGAPSHGQAVTHEAPAIDAYSRAPLPPHETARTQGFIQQMLPAALASMRSGAYRRL